MTREEKTRQLRGEIAAQLKGLVDRDYVLLGLPYYLNIGDILIWEGTLQYLAGLRHKCLNAGYRYKEENRIKDDTLIVLQGGGNFGDLWRFIQDERLDIVQRCSNNPILITPVTCWYEDTALIQKDAEVFAKHSNLTICARDSASFEFLKKHFSNRVLLVPDMAFCIDGARLRRRVRGAGEGTLFLKRTDKELVPNGPSLPKEVLDVADVRDWPSMEKVPPCWTRYRRLCKRGHAMEHRRGLWRLSRMVLRASDWCFHERCRKQLIREGVHFVGRYRTVYTTRLHVCILAILLNKEVTVIDNSYGKNASFFNTWLGDTEGVKLLNDQHRACSS